MSEEKKYSEHEIRCAINYALENYWILWPRNPRFLLQQKIIGWLRIFQFDQQALKEAGYIEREIQKAIAKRQIPCQPKHDR